MLHLFSVVNRLTEKKAVSAHMLSALDNMIYFAGQPAGRAFTALHKTAGLGSDAQLMAPYMWFDGELGEVEALGSERDGNESLQQRTALQAVRDLCVMDQVWMPLVCVLFHWRMSHFVLCPLRFSTNFTASYLLLVCIGPPGCLGCGWDVPH